MKISTSRSKNSFRAVPEDSKNGWKGRESILLDALNARYSHSQGGYILPNTKKAFLESLLSNGWKAKRRYTDKCPAIFYDKNDVEYTAAQAKKLLISQN